MDPEIDVFANTSYVSVNESSGGNLPYPNPGEGFHQLQLFVMNANRYILPVIIATGFLGNTVSFMVFIFTSLKRISTSVYLAALAMSDTGFLLCVWIGWFDNMGIHFFHNNGICQIVVYMTFVFSFTSVWYVNAFTIEMYICVFHPTKASTVCQPKFARNMAIILMGFAALFYIFSFWTANVSNSKCLFLDHAETMMIMSILDTFLTLIFPFSMIIVMITRILLDISRLYKHEGEGSSASSDGDHDNSNDSTAETMVTETSFSAQDPSTEPRPQSQRRRQSQSGRSQGIRAQSKIKRMLVVVVLVFLVLNLPSHAIRVQFFVKSLIDRGYRTTTYEFLLQQIFQILYYFNFAVNFVLYSACGKTFRSALLNLPQGLCNNRCASIRLKCRRITGSILRRKESADEDSNMQHSRLVDIHLSALHSVPGSIVRKRLCVQVSRAFSVQIARCHES